VTASRDRADAGMPDEQRRRLGVTVSKRVGNAVIRNRIKRGIREWFRAARGSLPEWSDLVVIARRSARDLSGVEIAQVLDRDRMNHWVAMIALASLRLYQLSLSAFFGPACRFEPSCSHYAAEAIERFGLVRGVGLAVRRIARCHPLGGSGYDPIPDRAGDGS
jgi:putative membrane protein insertion efficiency factor